MNLSLIDNLLQLDFGTLLEGIRSKPMTTLQVGGHGDQVDPSPRQPRGALAQFFLGDPQAWKGPEIRYAGGAAALKAAAEEAGITLYVHAPYVLNVATTNNRIRIPSRKFLQQYLDAAAEVGAAGVIVHGGHVLKNDDPAIGFDNWRKCIDGLDMRVRLLIENTAGGDNAMARRLGRIARLWDARSVRPKAATRSASASTPATPTGR